MLFQSLSPSMSARGLLVLLSIALVTLALFPDLDLPTLAPSGEHTDVVYHVIGFLVVTMTAMAASGRIMVALATMAALAVLLEGLQWFVPGRRVYLIDAIASLTGVGLSWPLCAVVTYWRRRTMSASWLRP